MVALLAQAVGGTADSRDAQAWDSRCMSDRLYLIVSAGRPLEAKAAMLHAPAPPDLCIRSPSPEAERAADVAFAGGYVRTIVEPLLAKRAAGESLGDFTWRCADALRNLYALDTRLAFVVVDELHTVDKSVLLLDEQSLIQIAEGLERSVVGAGEAA
jgi:hypothetical protein